jgi:hypothetical protein
LGSVFAPAVLAVAGMENVDQIGSYLILDDVTAGYLWKCAVVGIGANGCQGVMLIVHGPSSRFSILPNSHWRYYCSFDLFEYFELFQ